MIDLHMHSTFSDGSLTPEQLAAEAQRCGLTAASLTDHDGTSGVDRFVQACAQVGVLGIPGVEISVDIKKGTLHMLGYFIRTGDAAIEDVLVKIRDGRRLRNEEILHKLNKIGLAITWDEISAFASEDVVGRPHFAKAMVARGYVASNHEAFDRYLGKGCPAYAERFRMSPGDSIEAIRKAGGVAVLSHPFTLELKPDALRASLTEWRDLGLAGIEVYYSEHSPDLVRQYEQLARDLGLVATGGSDFHGDLNPNVHMGTGFGNLNVPDRCVDELKQRVNA